jgi:hypothetical protein
MVGYPQGYTGRIKAPFAGKMFDSPPQIPFSSSGMGEGLVGSASTRAWSAKLNFRFTEF